MSAGADRKTVDLLAQLNEIHLKQYPGDANLAGRIASYELAGRMQTSVPDVMDLAGESEATLKAYGVEGGSELRGQYARNCILARRLIEKGVRVVQLFNGSDPSGGNGITNWDSHSNILDTHSMQAEIMDQPTAALIADMKQRGLLEHTLVVWATEFGRMPFLQSNGTGRDHNPDAFTCFLTGAGVKPGFSYGESDEFGFKAEVDKMTVYDFNATLLHLMGLDHERLTFLPQRLGTTLDQRSRGSRPRHPRDVKRLISFGMSTVRHSGEQGVAATNGGRLRAARFPALRAAVRPVR